MGVEYYLENHQNKTYYFLGKGNWIGYDQASLSKYEEYKKRIIDAFSNLDKLKIFLNETYNKNEKVPQFIINRIADELFIYFKQSENIDIFSDTYHCPPEDYQEVGQDIYSLRSFEG